MLPTDVANYVSGVWVWWDWWWGSDGVPRGFIFWNTTTPIDSTASALRTANGTWQLSQFVMVKRKEIKTTTALANTFIIDTTLLSYRTLRDQPNYSCWLQIECWLFYTIFFLGRHESMGHFHIHFVNYELLPSLISHSLIQTSMSMTQLTHGHDHKCLVKRTCVFATTSIWQTNKFCHYCYIVRKIIINDEW